jgi:hypothetical protein
MANPFKKYSNLELRYPTLVMYDFEKNIYVKYEEKIYFLLEAKGEGEGVRVGEEF